jgi:hypothetical protein
MAMAGKCKVLRQDARKRKYVHISSLQNGKTAPYFFLKQRQWEVVTNIILEIILLAKLGTVGAVLSHAASRWA